MSSRYYDLVKRHCQPLFESCARTSEACTPEGVHVRAAKMLGVGRGLGGSMGGSSDLTASGLPIKARSCGERTMIVADVGWCLIDPHDRLMAARAVFSARERGPNTSVLHMHYNRLITALLTCEQDVMRAGCSSLVSLGSDLVDDQSVINARITMLGEFEAWQFLHAWCQDLLPSPHAYIHWLRSLRAARFAPHSVSVGHRQGELYASMEFARIQRSSTPSPTRALPALDGVSDDRLHAFLTAVHDLKQVDSGDERLRVEVDLTTFKTLALGMSFATNTSRECHGWLVELERRVSMVPCVMTPLIGPSIHIARVGIVLAQGDSNRASCELELHADDVDARFNAVDALTLTHIEHSMNHARESLIARQCAEGQWPGLDGIPFGNSSVFVTAFSGLALAETGAESTLAMTAARRGAQWIAIMRDTSQGWGLGPHVGSDVMTSALVMHLFARTQHVIDDADREWLWRQWSRDEGGFRFCDGPLHWGDVQTDVTALAWPLFDEVQRRARHDKFHDYLCAFATSEGIWPSYWWSTSYFSTYHHLRIFEEESDLRDQFPVDPDWIEEALDSDSTFEIAWACACAALSHLDDLAIALGKRLLQRQQIDGGWRGGKDLRMTSPGCAAPWEEARGELVLDVHGCLTTASALWALRELFVLCQSREDLHYL